MKFFIEGKSLFLALLTLALYIQSAGAAIRGTADFKEGGIWYSINSGGETVAVNWDGTLTWVGYGHGCYTGNVTVPQTVTHDGKTYTVTRIADYAFYFCNVTSVTLPSTIESIGVEAFRGTWNVELNLPSSLRKLGSGAFAETQIQEITIPSGVEELPNFAFRGSQVSKVTIPSTVKRIGKECFYESHITNCNLPYGVERIEDGTFYGTPLNEVNLPATINYIGNYAFKNTKIANIMLSEGIDSIGSEAFRESALQQITLPTTVTYLGENAFRECSSLTYASMNCPGLKEIGQYTFYNCTSLNQMSVLPDAVQTIGLYAYHGCSALDNFEIGASSLLTSIGEQAFKGTGIYLINIPNSVKSIGREAFADCVSLQSFVIPKSLEVLEYGTFKGCTGLESVTFPVENALKKVESRAFYNCASLESLIFPEGLEDIEPSVYYYDYAQTGVLKHVSIPSTVKSIGQTAFNKFSKDGRDVVFDFASPIDSVGSGLFDAAERINIRHYDSWVRLINKCTNAFHTESGSIFPHVYLNGQLLTEYVIPTDITSISNKAFYGNKDITSVVLHKNVTAIGDLAFFSCPALQTVSFGDSIKAIGGSCFGECNIHRLNVASMESWARLTAYYGNRYGSTWWKWFPNVYLNDEPLVDYVFPDDVTEIKASTFTGNTTIRSVTLPNSVLSIGNYAFSGCTSLETVVCSDALTSIGNRAFEGCKSLQSVTLGKGITNMDFAFYNCVVQQLNISNYEGWIDIILNANTNKFKWSSFPSVYYNGQPLTEYALPEGITSIREYAFQGNAHIQSVILPNSLKDIGQLAFDQCKALKYVTFGNCPDAVLGYRVFAGCPIEQANITSPDAFIRMALNSPQLEWSYLHNIYYNGEPYTDFVIPEGVTSIREKAFYNNKEITSITFPNSLQEIGYRAFYDCWGLRELTFGSSIKTIKEQAFYGCTFDKVDIGDIANWCGITFEGNTFSVQNYTRLKKWSNPLTLLADVSPIYVGGEEIKQLRIPTSVTKIGEFAFYSISKIESVTIPNSVKTIGDYAFWSCPDLTTLKYGKNPQLDSIGAHAFENTPLIDLALPSTLTTMGDGVFANCKSLQRISIPGNLSAIPASAFSGCSNLAEVELQEGVSAIHSRAFYGCPFKRLTIPTTLNYIGYWAFALCWNLEEIYLKDLTAWCEVNTPEGEIYEITSGQGGYYTNNHKNKHYYLNGTLIEGNIVIPNGVTTIAASAFSDNCDFTSITIPEGVKTIGSHAFNGTSLLQFVNLPSSIEYMGNRAFGYEVPESRFTRPYSPGSSVKVPSYWNEHIALYVNDLASFIKANQEDGFNFLSPDSRNSGYYVTLYVDGQRIEDLVVPEGIQNIADFTFRHFDFKTITLPSTLETLCTCSFYRCWSLENMYCRSEYAATGTTGPNPESGLFNKIYVPVSRSAQYKAKWYDVAQKISEAPRNVNLGSTVTITAVRDSISAHNFVYDDAVAYLDLSESSLDEDVTAETLQDIADQGTIIFLPEGTEGIEGTNIVANGRTPKLILRDSTDFKAPYDFTVDTLVHQRNFMASTAEASTICLPYNLSELPKGMKAYSLTEQDADGKMVFTETDAVEANKPYLVTTTIPVDGIQLENVQVKATPTVMPDGGCEGYEFRGTLTAISHNDAAEDEMYAMGADKEWLSVYDADESVMIPAGRAYLMPTDGATELTIGAVLKTTSPMESIKGDVNGDGEVDIADAVCIVNYVVGKPNAAFIEAAADVDGDGVVDIADAVRIVNLVVGKITALSRQMLFDTVEPQ